MGNSCSGVRAVPVYSYLGGDAQLIRLEEAAFNFILPGGGFAAFIPGGAGAVRFNSSWGTGRSL